MTLPRVGVVVVSFHAEEFIAACLESLVASDYPALSIVVVDNDSADDTVKVVRDWADGSQPFSPDEEWPLESGDAQTKPVPFKEYSASQLSSVSPETGVTLVHSGANRGFAGGVNVGLKWLYDSEDIDYYWILNPDTVVPPYTPKAFVKRAQKVKAFSVIGGRILYMDKPGKIHTDGGTLHNIASTAVNINFGADMETARYPNASELDYVPGANMFASRAFVDRAGLLDESWFIFFEEIDWQLRRGSLPIALEEKAIIYHKAGASIGTGSGRGKSHPFSVYFTYRNLLRFVRRWHPAKLIFTYVMAWLKIIRHLGISGPHLNAALRGLHGFPPPAGVRQRLPNETWEMIIKK